MDITWAELEPEEEKYDWNSIDAANQVERWRKKVKHLILSSIMPGETEISNVELSTNRLNRKIGKEYKTSIGMEDPMTGKNIIRLAMKESRYVDGQNIILGIERVKEVTIICLTKCTILYMFFCWSQL